MIPWRRERLPTPVFWPREFHSLPMGSLRVGHDGATSTHSPLIQNCYLGQVACVCAQLLSHVWLFVTPWTVARQAPLSMGFPRQKYCSGLPFPSPGDPSDPGMEPTSPASQAGSLPPAPPGTKWQRQLTIWLATGLVTSRTTDAEPERGAVSSSQVQTFTNVPRITQSWFSLADHMLFDNGNI